MMALAGSHARSHMPELMTLCQSFIILELGQGAS